jgi:L-amino acid N-acyltransferase YncA
MVVRAATPADAAAIAALYAPHVTEGHASFETEAPTAQVMAERITTTLRTHPWLVDAEDDVVLGYAYAGPHRARAAYQWCCEVSVYVAPQAHRRGVARRLYLALFELLVRQGFFNAYAGITLPNPASVGLHEALGFAPVGVYRDIGFKRGEWRDVGWWQLALQPHRAPEGPPLRFDPTLLEPALGGG